MRFRLVKAQRTKGNEVLIFCRDEFGDKIHIVVDSFRPFFYAPEPLKDRDIISCEPGYKSIFGEPIYKITANNPSQVAQLREKFTKTWEADILYPRRWLISTGIQSYFDDNFIPEDPPLNPIDLETVFLDIECYSKPGETPDPAKDKITCITWGNKTGGFATWVLDDVNLITNNIMHFSDEAQMLTAFSNVFGEGDLCCAWNSEFDISYLEKRCEHLKVPFSMNGVCEFDLLTSDRILHRRRSYRLKDVVVEEKIADFDEPSVDYAYMWDNERDKLIERNQRHVKWIAELDEKLQMSSYYLGLRELCGLEDLKSVTHNSVIIETLLMRNAQGPLPSHSDVQSVEFEGAWVMSPVAGLHENVAEVDMSKFYPSIILDEMLDPVILYHYRKSHPGKIIWPEYKKFAAEFKGQTPALGLIKELIAERLKLEKSEHREKLASIKGTLNSVYGVFGSSHFRLYYPEIAARITEVARNTIQAVKSEVELLGYKVVASDTDSLYCLVPKEKLEEFMVQLSAIVKKFGNFGMKLEHYYSRILFTGAKKRKAGIDENGKIHFTGFERVKSDSSKITKSIQETVLRMALEGRKDEIMPYLKTIIDSIKKAPLGDIAISKQLSRNPEEYSISGMQNYIKTIRELKMNIKAGDSVRIIPAKNFNFGVAVYQDESELTKKVDVDWDEIIRVQIRSKVEDILSVVGLQWEDNSGQVKLF